VRETGRVDHGNRAGVVLLGSDFKALAAVRSLRRLGVPAVLVDNQPRAAWYSRYVQSRHDPLGPMSGQDFTRFLAELASAHGLQGWLLMPTQDDALRAVAEAHAELATAYRLVTPPWARLRWVHDKRLLNTLADVAGVAHPRTWYSDSEDELASMDVTYPAIIKPAVSIAMQHSLGRKALLVDDATRLVPQFRLACAAEPDARLMVQELVPGGGDRQFSVASFCVDGEIVAAMTARRARQYPPDFGLGSSFVEAVEVPGLVDVATPLLRLSGLSGMLELEFKEDPRDGVVKLLDVNVRPWGWHGLCAASGLDFTAMQYRWATDGTLTACSPSYGRKWIRVATDIPAAVMEIRAGTLTAPAYLRSVRGRIVFSVLDLCDPLPVIGDAGFLVSRIVRRRLDTVVARWRRRHRCRLVVADPGDLAVRAERTGRGMATLSPVGGLRRLGHVHPVRDIEDTEKTAHEHGDAEPPQAHVEVA
jgi:D-aspartate ligase